VKPLDSDDWLFILAKLAAYSWLLLFLAFVWGGLAYVVWTLIVRPLLTWFAIGAILPLE
jgi:hypothetical protein